MRIRLRGLLVATFLAAAVAVNAQQPQVETIEDLTSAVQKLEAIALNPAIRPEVREINRGFLIEKRAKLLALLLEKKQARSDYLSASMSSLGTDQIVKVEEEISELNAKIKTLQATLPDEQSAASGTASPKTETSSAPASPENASSDPPASNPGKAPSAAPNPSAPQASTSTEPEKTKPTTVRSQYELRLAGTAADLRAAKATNAKATLNLQSNFYLFALALIAPKVEESQPAAIADLTAKAENIKTDKQTGSGQGSGGTTSLVTKASIPAVLGFAVENGALTRTDNKTTVSFSGTPVGIVEALAKKGFIENYQKDDSFDRFLRNFSFKLNFDTNRGATPGTFTGKQQLSGYSLRYKLIDQRDPRDKKYTDRWASLMADEGIKVTATLGDFFRRIFTHPTPAFTAWWQETQKAVADASAANVEAVLAKQMEELRKIDLGTDINGLMTTFGKDFDSLLKSRDDILNEVNAGWSSSIEYNNERRVGLPSLSNFKFIAEKGAYKGSLDLTANASVTFLNSTLAGSTTKRLRDVSLSGQLDVPIGNSVTTGKFLLSFAGQFQHLPNDEKAGGALVASKGNIGVGQVKLTIPIRGTAFKIPISFSFANRTELVKEKHVRGNFGLTFDLDSLLAKFNPFTQKK